METIAVLGAGAMGTALAQVAATNGHRVRAWSIEPDVLADIRDHRTNRKYLRDVLLDAGIAAEAELGEAAQGAGLVVISVPSQAVRSVARLLAPCLAPGQTVLNVAKGLEEDTYLRMSEVLLEEFGPGAGESIASMGGPAIAVEMARGHPMAVVVGALSREAGDRVQQALQNKDLKVETTPDIRGVELCATLKNAYAIALGLCDGLGFGTNTKAFVASLALEEMAVVAVRLGGKRKTVYGLAGLGDLLTTGFSEHSRNRTFGEKLGAEADWQSFLRTHTVEGMAACRAASGLARSRGLRTLLLRTIHGVLVDGWPAAQAMRSFFREFAYG